MNPFDLRGPEFLLFFTMFGAAVLAAVWIGRRTMESPAPDAALLRDYLEIAYLRGGPSEAIQVAAMNLIDRGLVEIVDSDRLQAAKAQASVLPARRLERLTVAKVAQAMRASDLFSDAGLRAAATDEFESPLMQRGLLPDERASARRLSLLGVAALALVAVAGTKIVVALSGGRSNIGFLIVETIVFLVIGYKLTNTLRTTAGDQQLSNLEVMFAGLRDRASSLRPSAGADDVAFLAAVFGAAVIPPRFRFDRQSPRTTTSNASCGSSCGTSFGSGGSSCGSSCGGGGSGGGCGGCGS